MWNKHCESLSLPRPNQKNDYYGSQKRKKRVCATKYDPIEPSGRDAQCPAPSHQNEGPSVAPISFTNDQGDPSGRQANNKGKDSRKCDLHRCWFFWTIWQQTFPNSAKVSPRGRSPFG